MSKPKVQPKRSIRVVFLDGTSATMQLKGFSTLPAHMNRSLSLNEVSSGDFWLCVSESLIPDMTKVDRLEIIRNE